MPTIVGTSEVGVTTATGHLRATMHSATYIRLMDFQVAQVNIGRLRDPLDSEQLAGFVAALDPVNASADEAPGFIWRLQTEEGNATAVRAFEWDVGDSFGVIINMSVWASIESLTEWIYGPLHRSVLTQRRQWFEPVEEATTALWWIPSGHVPTTDEAEEKVLELRRHGPSAAAFDLRHTFGPPDSGAIRK